MKKIVRNILSVILVLASIQFNYAGWLVLPTTGQWFYNDGAQLVAGQWKAIDNKYYYFGTNGVMYQNTITPDGYLVNQNGEWVLDGVVQYVTPEYYTQQRSNTNTNNTTSSSTGTMTKFAKMITQKEKVVEQSNVEVGGQEHKKVYKFSNEGFISLATGNTYSSLTLKTGIKKYDENNAYTLKIYVNGALEDEIDYGDTKIKTTSVSFDKESSIKLVWECDGEGSTANNARALYLVEATFAK